MTRQEIARKTPGIEEFAELGDYLSLPMRTYSSGMTVRLGFAIATSIDPEILILDEGLGAGDARFADRAKARVDALIFRSSILVLASHSNELIRSFCNKAILLDAGRMLRYGPVDEVLEAYQGYVHGAAPLLPEGEARAAD
jgi:ABC-type polysaccharide/polyol phosphate transport system ATPase subunit